MRNNEKTIPLTPRLRAAADWVPSGARLCDVGTDHAFLPAALVLEGRIPSAIASDIRHGPLERAQATLARYGLTDRVQTRLCPGLEAIQPGEADAVSICGMGGEMILHILEAAPWTREGVRLILQPQRSQPELRRWLWDHGYRIEAEKVICEGPRWYTLLLAEGGAQTMPPDPLAERTAVGAAAGARGIPAFFAREERSPAGAAEPFGAGGRTPRGSVGGEPSSDGLD